jgi:hypothetical protein
MLFEKKFEFSKSISKIVSIDHISPVKHEYMYMWFSGVSNSAYFGKTVEPILKDSEKFESRKKNSPPR